MKQNSTVKEQSLRPQSAVRSKTQTASENLDDRVLTALHAAAEKKAIEPVVLDLREIASFTDYFVIVSGANERQVQAISDEIYENLKKAGAQGKPEQDPITLLCIFNHSDYIKSNLNNAFD